MRKDISLFFKGIGMGAANVIPGVSGGTIALITGIFEELIDSIKSFDTRAISLLFSGRFREFSGYVHLRFLVAVFSGIGVSIISLAHLLGYLFANYPVQVWAYFFGLIVASVYFVSRTIEKWSLPVILFYLAGTGIALAISFLSPARENDHFFYLFVAGIAAICSMILPGLSGSYVLVLMGDYELVMIEAVNQLRLDILLPVVLGAGFGLIAFSRLLSWIYKNYRNQTIALLSGFILGSLATIWPWKEAIYKFDLAGNPVTRASGEKIIQGYRWLVPANLDAGVLITLGLILAGMVSIFLIELLARQKSMEE